jgi:hypothetical protein
VAQHQRAGGKLSQHRLYSQKTLLEKLMTFPVLGKCGRGGDLRARPEKTKVGQPVTKVTGDAAALEQKLTRTNYRKHRLI